MKLRIVTGGQTGVDQAALFAAKVCSVQTGGCAYQKNGKQFLTEEGESDWLRDYGLEPMGTYNDQYGYNVYRTDATLVFGVSTGGSNLVRWMCKYAQRPCKHIGWDATHGFSETAEEVAKWLTMLNVKQVCVAGNRESKNPGIGEAVYEWLVNCFEKMERLDRRPW